MLRVKPKLIITFTVRGTPVSFKRVADYRDPQTGQVRKLSDKKGRVWRSEIKDKFQAVVFDHPRTTDLLYFLPSDGPVRVNMTSYFQMVKRPKWRMRLEALGDIPYAQTPDWDNIGKNVCDALEGIAYKNDSRIFSGTSDKFWSRNPRLVCAFEFFPEITRENWDLDPVGEKNQADPILAQMELDLPEGVDGE